MENVIKEICARLHIENPRITTVHGGDINSCFRIDAGKISYFLKINSAVQFPAMFTREAEGLKALQKVSDFHVPNVIATGELDSIQYLLMEWLEKQTPSAGFWQKAGEALAQLHRNTNKSFGWDITNYIGSLPQANYPSEQWSSFYAEQRVMPLVKRLFNLGLFSKAAVDAAEKLCSTFDDIFPPEPPALLHGDLWSGNFRCSVSSRGDNTPAIFDPAVYYGHREMDIGMTLLFGGFPPDFYAAYQSCFSLENDWRKRVLYAQLYPLLVHAVLFQGHYISQCVSIINKGKT